MLFDRKVAVQFAVDISDNELNEVALVQSSAELRGYDKCFSKLQQCPVEIELNTVKRQTITYYYYALKQKLPSYKTHGTKHRLVKLYFKGGFPRVEPSTVLKLNGYDSRIRDIQSTTTWNYSQQH